MSCTCPHKTVPQIVKEKHGVNVAATGVGDGRRVCNSGEVHMKLYLKR